MSSVPLLPRNFCSTEPVTELFKRLPRRVFIFHLRVNDICLVGVQQADPDMDKEQLNKKGYDSLFSMRNGKGKGGTIYDEFVVYDPHQAIPRYIVHYKNLALEPAAIWSPISSSMDRNLTRVQYEMSQNFTGDTPAEYHFKLAESQFFRMSSRNNYKAS